MVSEVLKSEFWSTGVEWTMMSQTSRRRSCSQWGHNLIDSSDGSLSSAFPGSSWEFGTEHANSDGHGPADPSSELRQTQKHLKFPLYNHFLVLVAPFPAELLLSFIRAKSTGNPSNPHLHRQAYPQEPKPQPQKSSAASQHARVKAVDVSPDSPNSGLKSERLLFSCSCVCDSSGQDSCQPQRGKCCIL